MVATALAAALSAMVSTAASAAEWGAVGGSGDGVDMLGVTMRTSDWRVWESASGWRTRLRAEAGLSGWRADKSTTAGHRSIAAVNFTPMVTLSAPTQWGWRPYLEGGLGAYALSHTQISDRRLGSAFQFGEFVGAGFEFGQRYAVGLRIQHVSNGGIKKPNMGVTFGQLFFSMKLD
jgi:lipid A 3-O-deacylase